MLYAVGVPALFWTGLVAGVVVNAASSSPYFLGNAFFTRAYIGVVVLFVTNLVHRFLNVGYFMSMGVEYSLIIAAEALFFGAWSACDEAAKRRIVAADPKAQTCPKCRVILDRIFRVCPRCDTPLESNEDRKPERGRARTGEKG